MFVRRLLALVLIMLTRFKSIRSKTRLLHLVPLSTHFDRFLRDLNNSTECEAILKQIKDESLEKLIQIRARSIQLALKNLNTHSFHILKEVFPHEKLNLKEISWNESSAEVVEFVGKNDLVRPSIDWESLKKRLDGNIFHCYGLFHEKLKIPVSFVYIKLHQGIPSALNEIYNYHNTLDSIDNFDSCIFYSISSPFRGLSGIEFGSKLIKNVVNLTKSSSPNIKTFSTFSPIPQFRSWLLSNPNRFQNLLNLTAEQVEIHEKELIEACQEYLSTKHDPVAKFHQRNGAKVGPIRFKGDETPISFIQSYGMQVNYLYS